MPETYDSISGMAPRCTIVSMKVLDAQGKPVDLGGYYHFDDAKTSKAMRPSATLNAAIDNFR